MHRQQLLNLVIGVYFLKILKALVPSEIEGLRFAVRLPISELGLLV